MEAKSLRAIVFDFDGVIVDSESLHHRAYELALEPFGVRGIPREVYADQFSNRGVGLEYCARCVPGLDVRALKRRKGELFLELLQSDARLLPGAAGVVRSLACERPLALATGSDRAAVTLVLERFDLLTSFQVLVAREDYPREKPDPGSFLRACALLDEDPGGCLVVEDSYKGLRAARAAGIPCVVVPNDYTRGGDFAGAAAVLASISELSLQRAERIHRGARA
jgi:HAD superfamily hydrolase (TIGR01509 family)